MTDGFTQIIDNSEQVLNEFRIKALRGAEAIGKAAEAHAKAECPVDTGRLRNSISHNVVDNDGIYIGTNVEYAPYVEFIDRYNHPVGKAHFLRDAATNHSEEYKKIMQASLK